MSWFYRFEGKSYGPVSDTELDALVLQGVLAAESFVWQKGMACWVRYGEVRTPPQFEAAHDECDDARGGAAPIHQATQASAAAGWYCGARGQTIGPLSQTDLENLLQTGQLPSDTPVWRSGMINWQPYSSLRSQRAT